MTTDLYLTQDDILALLLALDIVDLATGLSTTEHELKEKFERVSKPQHCSHCTYHTNTDYHRLVCQTRQERFFEP